MRPRTAIAVLLVVTQLAAALGLGPRSVCTRPDGSSEIESILTPCCCAREQGPPCCGDDDETEPVRSSAVNGERCRMAGGAALDARCGCRNSPLHSETLVVRGGRAADSIPALTGSNPGSPLPHADALSPTLIQPEGLGTSALWANAARASPLLQLSTVILRR